MPGQFIPTGGSTLGGQNPLAPITPHSHTDGHAHPAAPVPPPNVPAKPAGQSNGAANSGIPTFTVREMQNIQGDILLGLPKQKQRFFFFSIVKAPEFRKRLARVIPLITTCNDAQGDRVAIQNRPRPGDRLHLGGINIAFSWAGLKKIDPNRFKPNADGTPVLDQQFEDGMEKHRQELRDEPANWQPQNWATWDGKKDSNGRPDTKGFEGQRIHGVLNIVGEDDRKVAMQAALLGKILGDAVEEVLTLDGKVLPKKNGLDGDMGAGHEHFGFKDGISQPFIQGSEGWGKDNIEFPGQGSVQPGVILLGRPGDNEEVGPGGDASTKPRAKRPAWAVDGSLLAFRYLHQRVPEFDSFLSARATPTVSKGLLGARMVGRWKSGAPVDIAARTDNPTLALDPQRNNAFSFTDNDADPTNPHSRCPFAAHIRKTNPRDDLNANPQTKNALKFERVLRRGMPYGEEVEGEELQTQKTKRDRGLLFVCYQSHLSRGFDLMQRVWANNPSFIFAKTPEPGVDPLIGQTHADGSGSGAEPREASGMVSINAATAAFPMGQATDEWVVSRGGEYFFAPSLGCLEKYLAM